MWTTTAWWKRWKVLHLETVWLWPQWPQWQIGPRCWDRAALADWVTDSLSGSPGLFLIKCWNLWFFIVVWKGSLPVMQETERLPCSKNARFPGPIPWAPSPGRSQNISSFRIQGHCIFILIQFFFSSTVPGSEVGAAALPQVLAACVIRTLTRCLG